MRQRKATQRTEPNHIEMSTNGQLRTSERKKEREGKRKKFQGA